MKKVIALVLVLSFIVSSMIFPVYATETEGAAIEFEILKKLGIMDDDTELEAVVTREQFAEYIGRMLDVDSYYTDKRYFTDVAENSVINTLTEVGVFKGTDKHLFEPDEEILFSHACVALVRALGYRFESRDVTINDYVLMAKRLDITDGINLTEKATGKVVLKMIYNTLMATVGEPTSYTQSGDSWNYYVDPEENETLIERVFDAYILRGQVTENCYTGLYDESTIANDMIRIGDTEFKCEIEGAENLIGQNIIALVSFKDGESSVHSIVYIAADEEENETVIIDAEQIESYDNYVLKYYNDSDKLKEIRFLPSMSLIYNGVAIGSNYKQYFNFDIGTLKCIKGNSDHYNVAIIEEVKNVTVKAVDLAEDMIYTDAAVPYNALDMSEDVDTYKKIYALESGNALGPQLLSRDDSISVIRSNNGKYIKMFLCSDTVDGVLESVQGGSKKVYTIDGVEYEAASGFNPLKNFSLGSKVHYILDITGKLAFNGKTTALDDKTLGYMYMMSDDEGVFDDIVKLKIYTQYKEHLVVECAEKVKFNGETLNKKALPARLKKFDGSFKRSMVLFKLNKNGELAYIDTPAETKEEKEETNSLWKMADEGPYLYDDSHKMFRPYYATNENTYVFCIPFDDSASPSEELAFDVYTDVGIPFNTYTTYADIGMYKFSEETPFIDVITQRRYEGLNVGLSEFANIMLVDDVHTVLDSYGDVVKEIYGLERQTTVSYRVEPGLDISAIESGDIIRVGRNSKGYVSSLEIVYDLSADIKEWGTSYESKPFGYNKRYTLGYVDSIFINNVGNTYTVKSLVNISETLGGELVEAHSFHTNNNEVMIYDSSRRTNKAYIGSINDILSYENAGDRASRLFVHCRGVNRMSWVFYK